MNYLKQNKDLNNVEDLSIYVNDVLKSLTEIDDPILKELTLDKMSKEYNLSISVLKNKLEQLEPVKIKKEIKSTVIEKQRKDVFMIGSEKILYFMMNGEEYIREYQKKLGFFEDSLYREIANEIVYFYETNKEITVADFITYVNDKNDIRDKVMEIVNDSANDEVTIEAMDEYIDALSRVLVKNEIKRLKKLMKSELDEAKKLEIALQIKELKKEDV